MEWKEFEKRLKGIKHKVIKDWYIELPFESDYRPVINTAKEPLLLTWHVIITEVTEKYPKPPIKIYWDIA